MKPEIIKGKKKKMKSKEKKKDYLVTSDIQRERIKKSDKGRGW